MPLSHILNNKLVLYKKPYNLTDQTIDEWEFWKWQWNIENINKSNQTDDQVIDENLMKNILNIKE